MMRAVALISAGNHGHPAFLRADIVEIAAQHPACMVSQARSDSETDHERPCQQQRIFLQILDRQHDISLAVTGDTGRDLVVILQVLFRLLELHDRDLTVRRRADKTVVLDRTSRCQACHNAPVTVRIGAGHDTQRILTRKRLIDHLVRVLRSVFKSLRRRAGLDRLIPDPDNAALARIIPENGILIADSRVYETDRHIFSRETQRRSLHGQDPGLRKSERIQIPVLRSPQHGLFPICHQPITFRCQ